MISAVGLSSTNFPAPSGVLLAAPDGALCLKEMAGSGKGALTDSVEKTGQPQCSKIICWVDKEVVCAGCGPWYSEPEIPGHCVQSQRSSIGADVSECLVLKLTNPSARRLPCLSKALGCLPLAFCSVNGQCVTMCPFKTTAIICHCNTLL